jgi:hypothetical protein
LRLSASIPTNWSRSSRSRLRFDPQFDVDSYTRQIAGVFELASRVDPAALAGH